MKKTLAGICMALSTLTASAIELGGVKNAHDPGAIIKDGDTYFNFTYQQFRENGEPAGITVFAYEVTDFVRACQALERLGNAAGN